MTQQTELPPQHRAIWQEAKHVVLVALPGDRLGGIEPRELLFVLAHQRSIMSRVIRRFHPAELLNDGLDDHGHEVRPVVAALVGEAATDFLQNLIVPARPSGVSQEDAPRILIIDSEERAIISTVPLRERLH